MRREKRGTRAEWEAPRRGNESIAQWQATSGAAPWGGMSGEMRPVRAKVRYSKQGVLLLPLQVGCTKFCSKKIMMPKL